MSPTLLMDRDGRVMILTLNRPEALNALSAELVGALVDAVRACDADDGIGVIVLTGKGDRAFTAGMDLKEAAQSLQPMSNLRRTLGAVIANCRKPVIAAVNGLCITGGMEIMLACNVVIAASTARFADTHVRVGLLPGWGISQRLARQIGPQRAKEISLSGNFVDAQRAFDIGLVNRVVEPAELMPHALKLAHDFADGNTAVVQAYKRLIDDGYAMTLTDALPMERERGLAHATSLQPGDLDAARQTASARNRTQLS